MAVRDRSPGANPIAPARLRLWAAPRARGGRGRGGAAATIPSNRPYHGTAGGQPSSVSRTVQGRCQDDAVKVRFGRTALRPTSPAFLAANRPWRPRDAACCRGRRRQRGRGAARPGLGGCARSGDGTAGAGAGVGWAREGLPRPGRRVGRNSGASALGGTGRPPQYGGVSGWMAARESERASSGLRRAPRRVSARARGPCPSAGRPRRPTAAVAAFSVPRRGRPGAGEWDGAGVWAAARAPGGGRRRPPRRRR